MPLLWPFLIQPESVFLIWPLAKSSLVQVTIFAVVCLAALALYKLLLSYRLLLCSKKQSSFELLIAMASTIGEQTGCNVCVPPITRWTRLVAVATHPRPLAGHSGSAHMFFLQKSVSQGRDRKADYVMNLVSYSRICQSEALSSCLRLRLLETQYTS